MGSNEGNPVSIDTIVIGAGHAGVSMSYALQEAGRDHVVLEKGRALEQWRSRRWDSFMMNTPQAYHRMYGQADSLPDEQMSLPLAETLKTWDEHIRLREFPIQEHTEVVSVELAGDGRFLVSVEIEGEAPTSYIATNVIAAPGNYQVPNIPKYSSRLSPGVEQYRVGTYTNPDAIREGAILVVGCGQTGAQIGEELLDAGRKVIIATSHVKGTPRSYRGEDIFFWMDRIGLLTMPKEALPDPAMKYDRLPIAGNNHAISHYSLARKGAILLGGLDDISEDGSTAMFRDNLRENIEFAQGGYDFLIEAIEEWIANNADPDDYPVPTPEPEWEVYPPVIETPAPTSLNLQEHDISAVLWATGWGADFSWLNIDEVKEELGPHGRPESCETSVPGFFWLGYHWLRFLNSGNVAGFHHDAPYIAERLV